MAHCSSFPATFLPPRVNEHELPLAGTQLPAFSQPYSSVSPFLAAQVHVQYVLPTMNLGYLARVSAGVPRKIASPTAHTTTFTILIALLQQQCQDGTSARPERSTPLAPPRRNLIVGRANLY